MKDYRRKINKIEKLSNKYIGYKVVDVQRVQGKEVYITESNNRVHQEQKLLGVHFNK